MISYLFSKFFETQKQEEQIKLVEERVVFEREGARPFYGFKNVEGPESLIDFVVKEVIVDPFVNKLKEENIEKKFLPLEEKEEEFRQMKAREKVGDKCLESLMILKHATEIEADQREIKNIERMIEQAEKEHNKKVQTQVESELGKNGVGKFAGSFRKQPNSLRKLIQELESKIPMLRVRIHCNREDLNKLKREKTKREVGAGLQESYIQMKRNVRIVPFQTYSDYMREKEAAEREENARQ